MKVDGAHPADAEDQLSSSPAFQIIILVSTYRVCGSGLRMRQMAFYVDIDNKMLHIANEPMSVSGVYLHLSCALVVAA